MSYEKRLCILKQIKKGFTADGAPLTGAVYAERLGEELTLTPRIAGLAPVREGRYALAVWAGGKTYCLELRGNSPLRVPGAPSLERGVGVLLCFVRTEPEPVAYGYCGSAPSEFGALLSVFGEKRIPVPVPLPPNQLPGAPSPQVPLAPQVPLPESEDAPYRDSAAAAPSRYDDEAIALGDYFDLWHGKDEPKEEQTGSEREKILSPLRLNRGGRTYYNTVETRLRAAMKKYPADSRLSAVFEHSEWVNTGSALLGVIYAEGQPKYLCVAAEGEADVPPPPALGERAVFVPADCYSDKKGYYIVFQDAETGEYVKADEA